MSEQLSFPNPLQVQHVTLLKIRRAIVDKYQYSKVEITERVSKAEYTAVSAQITYEDDKKTSVCRGQVLTTPYPLVDTLTAEIIALVFCCNEIGIEFSFSGNPNKIVVPDITPVQKLTTFGREDILSCRTIADIRFKMKEVQLDTRPLDKFIEQIKRESLEQDKRKRVSIEKIADKFFPRKAPAVYVKTQTEAPEIRKESKKKETIVKAETPTPQYQRTGKEAQDLLYKLTEAGITLDSLKEKGIDFSNMTAFTMYATDEQVKEILGE